MDQDRVERVEKAPLPWWAAGLLLGLIQVAAVALQGPLGVSTQFVVVDSMAIHATDSAYAESHKLISEDKYKKLGKGFWLDIGLLAGAFITALALGRLKPRTTTAWWRVNHGATPLSRFGVGFLGGFLILFGARFAHGCTSGAFASGWAQLSVAAIPMTITMFAFGMIAARLLYPKTPVID